MMRYENFLSDIAEKTQELITHNKSHFQEKVNDFISLYNYWKEQLFAGQREALKNKKKLYVGKMPDFRSKPYAFVDIDSAIKESTWEQSIEKKRPNGYILYNPYEIGFSNHSDFTIKGIKGYYWGKPLPENPVDTLRIRKDSTVMYPTYANILPKGHIQRKPVDENEDLMRKYFLLAVIHANVGYFGIPVINPKNEAAQLVWTMYRNMDGGKEDVWGNKIQNFITVAMKDVRANLKQCQRRTIHTSEQAMKGVFEKVASTQKETGMEFEFQKGQVFFNGEELRLPAGRTIEVLEILFKNRPRTVEYNKLDTFSNSTASDQLRGYISTINSVLKKNKTPYLVKAIRTFGYALIAKK